MAIARVPVPVPEVVEAVPPRALSRWLAATRQFCRARTLGAVGAAVIVVMFAVALLAPVLAPVAILGNSIPNLIMAIMVPMIPRSALVIRSSALAIREMPFVDAARAAGFGHARIVLRHMLPNVMAPYLIMLTAFLGQAILA